MLAILPPAEIRQLGFFLEEIYELRDLKQLFIYKEAECLFLQRLTLASSYRNTCSSTNANGPRSVPCSASKMRLLMSK